MNLEVGKEYSVSNRMKKSVVEVGEYQNYETNKVVKRTVIWRSGTVTVTPQNEDEIKILQASMREEDPDDFYPSAFEEWAFDSTWDGVYEEWHSDDVDMEEIQAKWEEIEDTEEGEDYFGLEGYVEEALGYVLNDTEFTIEYGIVVEEA